MARTQKSKTFFSTRKFQKLHPLGSVETGDYRGIVFLDANMRVWWF